MKTAFSLSLFFLSLGIQAHAADSKWLLCKNRSLVVNVLEHRSASGAGRVTSLAMIFGGHVLKGSFDSTDSDSATVQLRNSENSRDSYSGAVKVNHAKNTLALKGELVLNDEPAAIKAKLKCKELRGD